MSHFCGLVILTPSYSQSKSLEDSLAKYDENLKVPEYSNGEVSDFDKIMFVEYYKEKEGMDFMPLKERFYSELLKVNEIRRWSKKDGDRKGYIHRAVYDNKETYAEFFKETYGDLLEDFDKMYKEHGHDWNDNTWRINYETGNWEEYYTYNPYSVYDWYDIGGRWSQSIKLKNGEYVDECTLSDIDWTDFKPEDYEEGEKTSWLGKKYKALKDSVKWHFTKSNAPYCLFIDGSYYSKGDMGWFGMSNDKMTDEEWTKKFFEMIERLPSDSDVYLVDFHI